MKRTFFRAFGIACFLIGMFLFFIDKFQLPIDFTTTKKNSSEEKQIENLKKQLNQANKHIEQLELQLNKQEEKKTSKEEQTKTQQQPNDKTENIVKGTLYIYSGLSIQDVAKKLKEMGIINNSVEMELFLAQPEYAKSLQIGQFDLDSSMSTEEIANIITGKNKE